MWEWAEGGGGSGERHHRAASPRIRWCAAGTHVHIGDQGYKQDTGNVDVPSQEVIGQMVENATSVNATSMNEVHAIIAVIVAAMDFTLNSIHRNL